MKGKGRGADRRNYTKQSFGWVRLAFHRSKKVTPAATYHTSFPFFLSTLIILERRAKIHHVMLHDRPLSVIPQRFGWVGFAINN